MKNWKPINPSEDKHFMRQTLDRLCDPHLTEYREIDGMIAISMFSSETNEQFELACDQRGLFAMRTSHARTMRHLDQVEIAHPKGGFILINEAKIPHFTTRIDDALRLLDGAEWSLSHTGLAKCHYRDISLRAKLTTCALSLCCVGMRLHLHENY